MRPGEVYFEPVKPALKLTHQRHFKRLCRALLFNFPGLLYRPRDHNQLRPHALRARA